MPGTLQGGRHGEVLSDLDTGITLVELTQRLVMQIRVEIALQTQKFHNALTTPGRPVMRGECDIGAIGESVDCLGQISRPSSRVAHQRTAQGQQVMQVVSGVLGHAQRPETREVEMHFSRRLSAGRHLKFDFDAIDGVDLTGRGDVKGRHDDGDLARRGVLTESAPHLATRPAFEQGAVHITGPAGHRRARIDVLLHRMADEAFWRHHRDGAGIHLSLGGNTQNATEVIDMTMGVDHRDDRPVATVLPIQRQCRGRRLGADQRVDDDKSGIALDESDIRQVKSADLIYAFDHFVETLFGSERRLPPETGVNTRRGIVAQKRVGVVVPDHPAVGCGDDTGIQSRDEAAVGVGEVGGIGERQQSALFGVG